MVIYGDLGRPRLPERERSDSDTLWDVGQSYTINPSTPWDIIRCALLWYIWCQHCEHDLRRGTFHIGIILYKSWQVIVQVGMAA
jgi:hypothetical protein